MNKQTESFIGIVIPLSVISLGGSLHNGMQVYNEYDKGIYFVKSFDDTTALLTSDNPFNEFGVPIGTVKVICVLYTDPKPSIIQLKHSQWKLSVETREVEDNKFIVFSIVDPGIVKKGLILDYHVGGYAKLLVAPTKRIRLKT